MNIDEFVQEALLSIVRGVKRAQADPDCGDMIARLPVETAGGVSVQFDAEKNQVGFVEFDLATTVDTTAGGKAGISILGTGVGAEGKVQSSAANRIKFAVPLGFPAPEAQKKELKRREDAEEARQAEITKQMHRHSPGRAGY